MDNHKIRRTAMEMLFDMCVVALGYGVLASEDSPTAACLFGLWFLVFGLGIMLDGVGW